MTDTPPFEFRKLDASHDNVSAEAPSADSWTYDQTKSWMRVALENYFFEEKGRWAFEPFELQVKRDIDITFDLKNIYHHLRPKQQASWRTAISDLIAELPAQERYIPILDCLLSLSRLLPAYEILKVLPARIGEGPFGLMSTSDGETIFSRVLTTAAELSAQTRDAKQCVAALCTSSRFEPAYAGLAFVSLCRVDPDNWPEHLARLRSSLNQMIHCYRLTPADLRRHARKFLLAIGLDRLVSELSCFRLDPMLRDEPISDLWLWNALFQGEESLLRLPDNDLSNKVVLARRDMPDVVVLLPSEIADTTIEVPTYIRATEPPTVGIRNEPVVDRITRLMSNNFGFEIGNVAK